mmetsp:Transcript_41485/g.79469  ORF Transcript_41485/g.79469 Transcript_41485/m.79469 type:complete len:266 (-) Transcript_41485:1015-1812(-)
MCTCSLQPLALRRWLQTASISCCSLHLAQNCPCEPGHQDPTTRRNLEHPTAEAVEISSLLWLSRGGQAASPVSSSSSNCALAAVKLCRRSDASSSKALTCSYTSMAPGTSRSQPHSNDSPARSARHAERDDALSNSGCVPACWSGDHDVRASCSLRSSINCSSAFRHIDSLTSKSAVRPLRIRWGVTVFRKGSKPLSAIAWECDQEAFRIQFDEKPPLFLTVAKLSFPSDELEARDCTSDESFDAPCASSYGTSTISGMESCVGT